jgi:hypothetical protein
MWRNVLQPLKLGRFFFFSTLLVVLLGPFHVLAELETIPATEYVWTAPKSGTPVSHYFVQVRVNNSELREYNFIPTESIFLQLEYGVKYEVRVAGVDAEGHRGGFSPWSQAYSPEFAPPGF